MFNENNTDNTIDQSQSSSQPASQPTPNPAASLVSSLTRSSHVSLKRTGSNASSPRVESRPRPAGNSTQNSNPNGPRPSRPAGGQNPRNSRPRPGQGGPRRGGSSVPSLKMNVSGSSPSYLTKTSENQELLAEKLQTMAMGREGSKLTGHGNENHGHINPALIDGQHLESASPANFSHDKVVRLIPLGGVSEVGMNMTLIECGDDIVVIDTGLAFGNEKMPGVDYIIPDTDYLEQNRHKIKGVIYTHGHLDHIGAAPYILPKLGDVSIYGMPLTLALLKNRIEEFEMSNKIRGFLINIDKPLQLGCFKFQFFRLNHSIPDVVGLAIDTPMGRIMYCTDWKFDHNPIDGRPSDYGKIAQLGGEGVRLLLSDSTNALVPGYSLSEKDISKTINDIFKSRRQGKIIIATFSTLIGKMQQIVNACEMTNRKLVIPGRSMVNNFNIAFQLGYIRVPKGMVITDAEMHRYHPEEITVLTTGSQGEDNAGLAKMSRGEHPSIKLEAGDLVLLSNSVIPGNENDVAHLTSTISRLGVDVINNKMFDIHSGGHAKQEDLKMMIGLSKPDYFQPIHGEHFMLVKHGEIGESLGIPHEHIIITDNGRITELNSTEVVLRDEQVTDKYVLVDGKGVGDVSTEVINDRQLLAKEGVLVIVMTINKKRELVGNAEIISRGFVYMKSAGDLINTIKTYISTNFESDIQPVTGENSEYWSNLRGNIRRSVGNFIYSKTEKEPMILPVVLQV